jgi:hypothetical protein
VGIKSTLKSWNCSYGQVQNVTFCSCIVVTIREHKFLTFCLLRLLTDQDSYYKLIKIMCFLLRGCIFAPKLHFLYYCHCVLYLLSTQYVSFTEYSAKCDWHARSMQSETGIAWQSGTDIHCNHLGFRKLLWLATVDWNWKGTSYLRELVTSLNQRNRWRNQAFNLTVWTAVVHVHCDTVRWVALQNCFLN